MQDNTRLKNSIHGVTALANHKSAIKRAKQSEKLRQHNASHRSEMRTLIKKVRVAIAAADVAAAKAAYISAVSFVDRYSARGLLHKNAANRYKSRLALQIKALDQAA